MIFFSFSDLLIFDSFFFNYFYSIIFFFFVFEGISKCCYASVKEFSSLKRPLSKLPNVWSPLNSHT